MIKAWLAVSKEQQRLSRLIRHEVFCLGDYSRALRRCNALRPTDPHDEYDTDEALYFGVSCDDIPVGTARLIAAPSVTGLPTGRLLERLPVPLDIRPGQRYIEPSQFGILQSFQHTRVGNIAYLRLTGEVINEAIAQGAENFLLTLRGVLFEAMSWLPWSLGEAFCYPAEEGGPLEEQPMWPATINLHEFVVATQLFRPAEYQEMFPVPPTWLDLGQVRPRTMLATLAMRNRLRYAAFVRSWKNGRSLPQLAPLSER
jgi:hypothetical protein